MPDANEMTVDIMAVVAQAERKMISVCTKEALVAAKVRGKVLGKPENLLNQEEGRTAGRARRTELANNRDADLADMIADIRTSGASSGQQIVAALNDREVLAARGGAWSGTQVLRVIGRLPA